MRTVRTLLIDNYDSFTYNLFQMLAEVNGAAPLVVRNDDTRTWQALAPGDFDNVVVSPGPGHPATDTDLGLSRRVLTEWDLPLLGVCLGHQALCLLAGAAVVHAPEPVHGRTSDIRHDGQGLFANIPSPLTVVRYHSLTVRNLPADLRATAHTPDGQLMAVAHRHRPRFGVQFHPESISSEHGHRMLANFRDLSLRAAGHRPPHTERIPPTPPPAPAPRTWTGPGAGEYRLHVREVAHVPDADAAFTALFADAPARFWLDSSRVEPGLSRFTFLGAPAGPLGEQITYDVAEQAVRVKDSSGGETRRPGTLFDHLEHELAARALPAAGLPFEFNLGYVGYLGYETKADSGGEDAHRGELPDGAFMFADRMLALDHEQGRAWLLALSSTRRPATAPAAERWLTEGARTLAATAPSPPFTLLPEHQLPTLDVHYRHSLPRYRELVEECRRLITDGETYEVCLTNMLRVPGRIDPLTAYRALRTASPAPYAAYLQFPGASVLSSSPERFLRIGADGWAESKPIKGTRPRGAGPAQDAAVKAALAAAEKDRSENLMIVDLVRNDLGQVCDIGSVHVPGLFEVETYATVHQLVSTVRGRLAPDVSRPHAVRAAFPGGSMTGAPKVRTMQFIDRLERGPRGVYSGALGYFALSGAADLSIVIRTIVATEEAATIGVGGAVVALSDPDDEVREMLLKAQTTLAALRQAHAATAATAAPDRELLAGSLR
ncbi:aminodeoxychorismate synthase component I [Streptomyces sp. V1I6]|uniref:aminodeoxychorismate synthase component I n=1 Tax=Streptomyces sp. V1I6 TaxID=3042273 RepID=UPI002783BC91|nr:aminodeoxychorismate synthase component I [Streptomyces sp. V1I6]MDQ0847803.1 para-aminobenzoate synthetase [Streptomyces sp. V1I6]